MQTIQLTNVPNQSFQIVVASNVFELLFRTTKYGLIYDISINNVPVISGHRALPMTPLIPYKSLVPDGFGNFVFSAYVSDTLDFTKFNSTQTLVMLSSEEMEMFTDATRQ